MVLTYRYRIKDATRRHLQRQAWAVNQVWNYCGETQNAARRHNKHWPSGFDLIKLVRQNRRICIGNVNAGGLARTSLAKSVLDAGWSQLRSQLHYKAIRHGVEYIEVDERLTTQVCSACAARGGPQGREDLVVREWICGGCGAWHDRDINSAINILVSGRNVGLQQTEIPSLQGGEDVKSFSSLRTHHRWTGATGALAVTH
jgi:transposase